MTSPLVVAIDGPSGSGKSSTSRGVADRLGLAYLDTGAMYRAMTWALLQRGVDLDDPAAVASAADAVRLESGTDPLAPTIHADGTDVAEPIRTDEVTGAVSLVAAVPHVRELLVDLQRRAIGEAPGGIVVEGRDIGSVVVPDAPVKIYLVADPAARAARRAAENGGADAAATEAALAVRDQIDSTRAASPLVQAHGAVVVDGTHLTLDEVIDTIVGIVDAAS
ncbi:(d)CMP kinase [Aeromicrobium fastidiosum]|uniref:Cytidylate kinase n=1 Tax=Aeromicrobium fastidiosum TaxID=52699 RepID=A0A641AHE2_9ACTN|nr:(d)CMP kinase [Aeromicrobium fastidiosum]KAA1372512.1 (d)CMP kinase [Aeromicrobium fastidiosum]MBP2391404.1 cytidylate kinase [Aeromicrobium fastidiosum]